MSLGVDCSPVVHGLQRSVRNEVRGWLHVRSGGEGRHHHTITQAREGVEGVVEGHGPLVLQEGRRRLCVDVEHGAGHEVGVG